MVLAEKEIRPLSSAEILHADLDKLSVTDRKIAYCFLQHIIATATARKEELNLKIKEDVRTTGVANDKGHVRQDDAGTVATVEKRVAKTPDEKELKKLLEANKINPDSVYDDVTIQQLNLSKVNDLVDKGKLKQADVDKLFKTTYALTVDPSYTLKTLLEEAKLAFASEKAALAGAAPALAEGKTK